jgi:hypothetical protein
MTDAERQQTARSEEELLQAVQKLKAELGSEDGEDEGLLLDDVPLTPEALRAFSDEELRQQAEVLVEQLELVKKHKELNRRAVNLGLLRIANQSPRCSHMKSNGEPCRAPAMGNRLFCIFHSRALDTQNEQRLKVNVLEDPESLQLTVKQVMEQVVSGRMEPQTASLLLRAVQIANSTLKPKQLRAERVGPKSSRVEDEEDADWGNAGGNSGVTPEGNDTAAAAQ